MLDFISDTEHFTMVLDLAVKAKETLWIGTADIKYLYVVDIDPAMGHCKGMEIASWLTDNAKSDTRYVIIDDEYVILDSQQPHFILTNPYAGITEEDAARAISILNN